MLSPGMRWILWNPMSPLVIQSGELFVVYRGYRENTLIKIYINASMNSDKSFIRLCVFNYEFYFKT